MNRAPNIAKQQWLRLSAALTLLYLFTACNALQYVPEDEKLYTGAEVKIEFTGSKKGKAELSSAIESAVYPEPNSKFLGMRIGLWAHYKSRGDTAGFIARFINKRFGEEPVYLSEVNTTENRKIFENRAINKGFFYPEVKAEIREKKKTGSAYYQIKVGSAYQLKTYRYERDSLYMDQLIRTSLKETELRSNSVFSVDGFKKERGRIDQYLKNRGYYQFNEDYLIFDSDTNQYEERYFDLYLDMKEKVPAEDQIPYRINKVSVYPNHSASRLSGPKNDTLLLENIAYIQEEIKFKPQLLKEYISLQPGDFYKKRLADLTTRRLSSLGIYQYASLRFDVIDSMLTDSVGYLNASVLLTPGPKYNLRAGMNGTTKSTGFAGPGVYVSYQNRNLFYGGEVLDITANLGYEFQIARGRSRGLNNFELKLENSLTFPRLIAPFFKLDYKTAYSIPNSRIKLNYNLQQRALYYTLNSFLLSYGYTWSTNRFVSWEFNPISINYMNVSNQTTDFEDILNNNQFLARSFDDQFIPAITANFQYSELQKTEKLNEFYFNLGLGQAGFITEQTGQLINGSNDLFGQPYAQYLKADVDFRHYLKINEESKWVSRFFAGVGYPYGNSQSLPYIKQYFSGGPNSVRAFQVRSLGPGNFRPPQIDAVTFFDQAGDIRLELNTEYRFPLVSYLKGALFADAGNIWLMNENPDLPGGQFDSDWQEELAVGAGFGLRLDLDVLVIRLDIAHPIRNSYLTEGSYRVDNLAFNKLVWNFAIGYPF